MRPHNVTLRYSLLQCCFWSGFASVMGFASVYLLGSGFTNSQIGLLTAAAGAISAVLQPVVATFADRPGASLKKIVAGVAGLLLLCTLLLLPARGNKPLTGLLFGASIAVIMLLNPLLNSVGAESQNRGRTLNFGVSRGMGSLIYAAVAYLLGRFTANGTIAIPICTAVVFAGFLLALVFFPLERAGTEKAASTAGETGRGLGYFIRRYKRFCAVLCGWVFLYISHSLLNGYTFQIVGHKGGGSEELGVVMAVCACVELPTMFGFSFLLKRAEGGFYFRLSTVFFAIKTLCTLLAPNIPVLYGVQLFQMLGWALVSVAAVYYVNSLMAPEDAVKGQAYMTMSYTVGNLLGNLLGGPLIDLSGVDAMLIFATAAAFLGMAIVLIAAGKTKKEESVS